MKLKFFSLLGALLWLAPVIGTSAQSLSYNSGQAIAPAYEGWEEDADGTKYFLFGYMNRNWEEEPDIPVGPANSFSPGVPDQGQPTHFLPRRNRFVFRVKVPAGWTEKDEMTWTITSPNGRTEKAYASLRTDYKVDDVVKASETGALGAGASSPEIRANKPPVVKVDGAKTLTAKVGQPLSVAVVVTDDGVPKTRGAGLAGAAVSNRGVRSDSAIANTEAAPRANRAMQPPARATVGKNVGLHVSWFVYRSSATSAATFDPPQIKAWEDTRAGANSPWAPIWVAPPMPADGKVSAKVTFSEPGTYVLRGLADDGALTGSDDVTVTVTK
ncbi:MAG TPA: hypothetical protein VM032_05155 [Vicinamibacterales bacterium]|nr:hypothetical protein [Vicinamibacterales bacterium]